MHIPLLIWAFGKAFLDPLGGKFFVNPQKTRSALYRGPPNYPSIYMGVLEATFYPPLIENFCKTSKKDPFLELLKNPSINKAIQRAYSCPLLAEFFIFVENDKKFCAGLFRRL